MISPGFSTESMNMFENSKNDKDMELPHFTVESMGKGNDSEFMARLADASRMAAGNNN